MKEQKPLPNRYAMDLDDTIANTKYDRLSGQYVLGEPIEGMREVIHELREKGNEVVIYTARKKKEHPYIKTWLINNGIEFDRIKKKMLAKVYVDDRAIHPVDFLETHRPSRKYPSISDDDFLGQSD